MNRPIRVLHLLGSMGRAGVPARTLDIIRHIDRQRFDCHFCVTSGLPGELDEESRALGAEVHRLRIDQPGFSRSFRRLLRYRQFTAVHSHSLFSAGYTLRLAAKSGVPVRVAHFHTTNDGRRSSLLRLVYRKLMRRWIDLYATHILAVSRQAMTAMWKPNWESDPRCQVVHDGLDTSAYNAPPDRAAVRREFGLTDEAPLYIHVGRLTEAKNHPRLISIFARLLQRQPAATLLLVGPGSNTIERGLRRQVAELGIGPRVVFCGERSDVPRLLKVADALVFPSLWEGLPGAVLEAHAAGTPVLASDLPSIREIAEQLPGIRRLSLNTSDSHWAQVLAEMTTHPPSNQARLKTLESFRASTFAIGQCAERNCQIWQVSNSQPSLGGVGDG